MKVLKLVCKVLNPIVRIVAAIYRIVVRFLSYALLGLCFLCLLAIGAELFHYGFTKEAIAYLVLGIISIVVRFGLLLSMNMIEKISLYIQMMAGSSTEDIYESL